MRSKNSKRKRFIAIVVCLQPRQGLVAFLDDLIADPKDVGSSRILLDCSVSPLSLQQPPVAYGTVDQSRLQVVCLERKMRTVNDRTSERWSGRL